MPPKGSAKPKAEKSETKTVKKAAKDDDKPKVKRAPSPYILFCNDKRAEIKVSHPNATFGETGKILGQMWAVLDDKSKQVSNLCFYAVFIYFSQYFSCLKTYQKESAARKAALESA